MKAQVDVCVTATILLEEEEIAALDALAGYDIEAFLRVFYKEMGSSYLRPHEAGLRSLFLRVRSEAPPVLRMVADAREALKGPK